MAKISKLLVSYFLSRKYTCFVDLCKSIFLLIDPVILTTISPQSFNGKDIKPFNSFSLICKASKPARVVPLLQITWFRNDIPLDTSDFQVIIGEELNMTEVFSTISTNSARTRDSGSYTCAASVLISDSSILLKNTTANIVISGK